MRGNVTGGEIRLGAARMVRMGAWSHNVNMPLELVMEQARVRMSNVATRQAFDQFLTQSTMISIFRRDVLLMTHAARRVLRGGDEQV